MRVLITTDDPQEALRLMDELRGSGPHAKADMHEVITMRQPPRTANRWCVTANDAARAYYWRSAPDLTTPPPRR